MLLTKTHIQTNQHYRKPNLLCQGGNKYEELSTADLTGRHQTTLTGTSVMKS